MKTVIIAAFLSCLASISSAEEFLLSVHGAWTVEFISPDNQTPDYCSMTSSNESYEHFVVTAEANGKYSAYWNLDVYPEVASRLLQSWHLGDFSEIIVQVDRTGFDAQLDAFSILDAGDAWMLIKDLTPSFLRALSNGSYIRIGNDSVWSLNGSAAALQALASCRTRLGAF